MGDEPSSILTYADLIIEVSRKMGVGYYGVDGEEVIQVPIDPHDLDECKRHVNNAIRMFLLDGPVPHGWRWARPVALLTIWGDINFDPTSTLTSVGFDEPNNLTTLTIPASETATLKFYETMELHPLTVRVDSSTTREHVIDRVISATQIRVQGDASAEGGNQWKVETTGNFTMPSLFGGQFLGDITYTADTNQGVSLDWTDESTIRKWRENITDETGDPFWAAIRPIIEGSPRKRWELVLYPKPDEVMEIEFPFLLHFDKLVDLDEVHPAPFSHDETIKAACLAVVEQDVEGQQGVAWNYYKSSALAQSHVIDFRSAPHKIGYFGNPTPVGASGAIKFFRNHIYQRPSVTYNT